MKVAAVKLVPRPQGGQRPSAPGLFNTEGSAIFRMARTLADHFMAAVYARAWPFLRHVERSSLNAAIRRCDQYEKDVRAWSAARARVVKRSKARPPHWRRADRWRRLASERLQ